MSKLMISDQILEKIKHEADIVSYIQQYIDLKPSGKYLKACCPFHQEKTPSFFVNRDRQNYHCFGCGESGDIITFVMKYENYTFVDAVKKLADLTNVRIEEQKSFDPYLQKKNTLLRIHEIATEFYHSLLADSSKSVRALDYLKKRGLSEQSIKKFKIGLSTESWNDLLNHLRKQGYSDVLLNESGLICISQKNGKLFDRFRNRILFPIYDHYGRVVGFSGRILIDDQKSAKYMNSPESIIFNKSTLLYGFHLAKNFIVKNNRVILCEGHMDVCMMHQCGFYEAIAVQGTSFTIHHAKLLSGYTKNFFVLFDGDDAGLKASEKVMSESMSYDIIPQLVQLPEKEDPASILSSSDKSVVQTYISESQSIYEYKVDQLIHHKGLSPVSKMDIVSEMKTLIAKIRNPVLKASLIQILSAKLNLREETINEAIRDKIPSAYRNRQQKYTNDIQKNGGSQIESFDRELLRIALNYPEMHERLFNDIELDWFSNERVKLIMNQILKMYCEKSFQLDSLRDAFKEDMIVLKIINDHYPFDYKDHVEKALSDTILKTKSFYYTKKMNELNAMIKNSKHDKDQLNQILKQLSDYRKKLISLNHTL